MIPNISKLFLNTNIKIDIFNIIKIKNIKLQMLFDNNHNKLFIII